MRNHRFDIAPTSGALGATIEGADLSGPLDDSDIHEMREALNEYGVIFFRDQKLTPEQHIAFARSIAMFSFILGILSRMSRIFCSRISAGSSISETQPPKIERSARLKRCHKLMGYGVTFGA